MANSEDPDQTAPCEQSDLGLLCLLIPICPNTYGLYSVFTKSCPLSDSAVTDRVPRYEEHREV